jgi:hypothetical protein
VVTVFTFFQLHRSPSCSSEMGTTAKRDSKGFIFNFLWLTYSAVQGAFEDGVWQVTCDM